MAVLVRFLSENRITKEQFEKLKTVNIRLEASRRGLDTALYEKSPEKDQYASFGEYARLLEEKKSVLTDSLYTQFLQLERANKLKIVDIELLSDEIENRPCNTMCCQGFTNFRKYFYISTIISL